MEDKRERQLIEIQELCNKISLQVEKNQELTRQRNLMKKEREAAMMKEQAEIDAIEMEIAITERVMKAEEEFAQQVIKELRKL